MAKILIICHGYPPQQNAGAEWYLKEMNTYLLESGHLTAIHGHDKSSVMWDFVTGPEYLYCNDEYMYTWADLVITHLDLSQAVTEECQRRKKPCINIIHHNWEIPHLRTARPNVYCVYNSEWVLKDRAYPHRSLVVRPPVNPARFKDVKYNPAGKITLVNCNADKGALIFQKIARACPDLKFLAVKGHHGPQITMKAKNITQIECQDDICTVLSQTSILLVPSVYESYGRIGIEAMACGIPVIASDTPGLRESLEDMGMFTSRNFIPGWLQNIRSVNKNKPDTLKGHADDTWRQTTKELNQLHNLINEIACKQ